MSMIQLTEYLLWKSIKHKPIGPSSAEGFNVKEEFPINKQEIFDNDMICRVCTNPGEIPITEKINGTLILTAIRAVANISIMEADNYPKYVCKLCIGELKVAFQFKKKCEASDMAFRKAISSETMLVTNSQPMVKHDFSLLLHQIHQRRLAQKVWIKSDNTFDDEELNNEPIASPLPEIHTDTASPITHEIPLQTNMRKTRSPSVSSDTDTHNRIMNILKKSLDLNDLKAKTEDLNDSGFSVTDSINVDIHKTCIVDKKQQRVHKCKRCELTFDTKEDIQKHRKEKNCVYHACPLCGKLVLNLTNHRKIMHSRANKYTCHECGKIYYSSGALSNHMHKHKKTKEYFCEHCPYRGIRKSYLVCHMRVHTGEHKYLCSMCPLKFTNFSNMAKHQLVHLNKKFECSKCKRMFREEKLLKEHFDSAHLNIRYRCTICSRHLISRKKLLRHELRVHKREKKKLYDEEQRVVVENDSNN